MRGTLPRMPPRLSPELIKLLESVLDTLEKVDISWHVATANKPVSLVELQERTYLEEPTLRSTLGELVADRVLVATPEWTLSLGPRAKLADFEALMKHYTDDRLLVINTSTRIAMERIRNMAASTFADAFLIRPKRKKGDDDA
jgi:hypothetical protein